MSCSGIILRIWEQFQNILFCNMICGKEYSETVLQIRRTVPEHPVPQLILYENQLIPNRKPNEIFQILYKYFNTSCAP